MGGGAGGHQRGGHTQVPGLELQPQRGGRWNVDNVSIIKHYITGNISPAVAYNAVVKIFCRTGFVEHSEMGERWKERLSKYRDEDLNIQVKHSAP